MFFSPDCRRNQFSDKWQKKHNFFFNNQQWQFLSTIGWKKKRFFAIFLILPRLLVLAQNVTKRDCGHKILKPRRDIDNWGIALSLFRSKMNWNCVTNERHVNQNLQNMKNTKCYERTKRTKEETKSNKNNPGKKSRKLQAATKTTNPSQNRELKLYRGTNTTSKTENSAE